MGLAANLTTTNSDFCMLRQSLLRDQAAFLDSVDGFDARSSEHHQQTSALLVFPFIHEVDLSRGGDFSSLFLIPAHVISQIIIVDSRPGIRSVAGLI